MQIAKLIFPHQLFQYNPLLAAKGPVYLVEEHLFFRQYRFHKQKIAFHRASMKHYETFLMEQGCQVHYIESTQTLADVRHLIAHLHNRSHKTVAMLDPVDHWLRLRVENTCKAYGMELLVQDTPMFVNSPADLKQYFKPERKRYFQAEFYKQQRLKRQILLDEGSEPLGGKWSFDEDNRKRYPKDKAIPRPDFPIADAYMAEAHAYTELHYAGNPGELGPDALYPTNFAAAKHWFNQFLEARFYAFGDYEDAIVHKEILLNHSLISPLLNAGLLSPDLVLNQTLQYGKSHDVPLNSLEGFVRQIMGWREYIRGVYNASGSFQRTRNFWGFSRPVPESFYKGNTGILPVDNCIAKVSKTGYCHHIERLMVLGNFMLLCEFDPDAVYRWFMELFIDAYDWVMVPNVYGMSQFADGGRMCTKPYISGSNYLMKMGDYPKGEWQVIWDALFWRFLDKQRVFFLSNPRLSMLIRTFDKWDAAKKTAVLKTANDYLAGLDKASLQTNK